MNKRILLLMALFSVIGMLLTFSGLVLAQPTVITNSGLSVVEGSTDNVIGNTALAASETGIPSTDIIFTVTTRPQHGTLYNNGIALDNNDTFTQADIEGGDITYDHNGDEASTDSFDFGVASTTGPGTGGTFTFSVTAVNDAPTAVNDTIYVQEGGTVTEVGSGDNSVLDNDTDPENDTLSATTIAAPTYANAFNLNTDGTFSYTHNNAEQFNDTFTYEACDNGSPSECDTASVTIVITPVVDIPPNAQDDTFSVDENSNGGVNVGTVQVNDVEVNPGGYDSLTFTIQDGDPSGYFTVDNTGLIEVASGAALNHEGDNQYILTVRATDEANQFSEAEITININDVNEAPSIPSGQSFSIAEDSPDNTLVGRVQVNDPDVGDSKSFVFTGGSNSEGIFNITNLGDIRVVDSSKLDYDTTPSYALQVRVTDGGGLQDVETVMINLTNVNEAPVINNQEFDIDENRPNGASIAVIAATDPDSGDSKMFTIIGGNDGDALAVNPTTGQLTVNNSNYLDFEARTSITATIEVADGNGLTDSAVVTVDINNVNEAPVVPSGQSLNIAENSSDGTAVGVINATDDDLASVPGEALTFAITDGNTNTTFAINSSTGQLTVNDNALLDHETMPSFTLEIRVTDTNWDGDGANQTVQNVLVNVTDQNEKPTINSGQSFTITGYSPNGTVVGNVTASDPDNGDSLRFAITGGNLGDAFAMNSSNGRITVNNSSALNYETRPTFNLSVRVTDEGNLSANTTVTINLTEPPEFQILLPIVVNNYVSPDEPNNRCAESHGLPLNELQSFFANDVEDWYTFSLSSNKNVTVELTNYNAQGQIIAYSGSCGALTYLKNNGNFQPTKILNLGALAAGQYYIRVVTDPPFNTSTPYNLRVIAP